MRFASFVRQTVVRASCVALVSLAACSSVMVNTERAPDADFAGRKTYAWVPNPQLDGAMDASISGQQIRADVDQALQTRGFQPAGSQPPDMLVDYRVILRQQMEIMGGPGWGGVSSYNYTQGTLIIALENPQNGYFLWRGVAQGIVDPQGGGSGQGGNIQSAVQQMFAKFPN